MSVKEKMTAIADAIRGKTGKTEKLTLDAMASGVNEVYIAGGVEAIADLAQGTIDGEYASDEVTSLRTGAFCKCANLTSVSLPNCTKFVGFRQFSECTKMTTLNLPKLETIPEGNQNFGNLTSVGEIRLPSLTTISGSSATFTNCHNIKKIIMPLLSGSTIGSSCFDNNYWLDTLVLGGDTLNPLGNTNVFRNAGTYGNGLSIYVPDALVDTYKTATNWTAFADKIKPMSELEE